MQEQLNDTFHEFAVLMCDVKDVSEVPFRLRQSTLFVSILDWTASGASKAHLIKLVRGAGALKMVLESQRDRLNKSLESVQTGRRVDCIGRAVRFVYMPSATRYRSDAQRADKVRYARRL